MLLKSKLETRKAKSPKRKRTHSSGSLERVVSRWVKASRTYNRDCNMRARAQDDRQNKLMERAEKRFNEMMEGFKHAGIIG